MLLFYFAEKGVRRVKVGEILKANQAEVYTKLNKKPKRKRGRRGKCPLKEDELSFSDYMELMKHDSYKRGKGGALRQKTWSD